MKKPFLLWALLLVFAGTSVALSYQMRGHKQELQRLNQSLRHEGQKKRLAEHQKSLLQEALLLNLQWQPVQALLPLKPEAALPLLYLKANACSPCNLPVLEGLLEAMAAHPDFHIVSHPSNRHFLSLAMQKAQWDAESRLHWQPGSLYTQPQSTYDAELLLLNPHGMLISCMPLELIKEQEIFSLVLSLWGLNPTAIEQETPA